MIFQKIVISYNQKVGTRLNRVLKIQEKEVMHMKLYPLQDRVVVKLVEAEETTKSGIILTGQGKAPGG